MGKRIFIYLIAITFSVVSILAVSTIASAVWPLGDKKINCCIKKWIGKNPCSQMTKEECEKAGGKVVTKCEECK